MTQNAEPSEAHLVIWSTTWFTWVPPFTVQMELTKLTCTWAVQSFELAICYPSDEKIIKNRMVHANRMHAHTRRARYAVQSGRASVLWLLEQASAGASLLASTRLICLLLHMQG